GVRWRRRRNSQHGPTVARQLLVRWLGRRSAHGLRPWHLVRRFCSTRTTPAHAALLANSGPAANWPALVVERHFDDAQLCTAVRLTVGVIEMVNRVARHDHVAVPGRSKIDAVTLHEQGAAAIDHRHTVAVDVWTHDVFGAPHR